MRQKFLLLVAVSFFALDVAQSAHAQDQDTHSGGAQGVDTEKVVVTGSRIAHRNLEGIAPVSVITGEAIDSQGFRGVFDVLTNLPQNTGSVQGEDFGSTFTPAANFVNLRGLGPNHSLVLVNGRRLSDYPVAYDGSVNAVNLANIPNAFVDQVEVLTGSAGAVYGSDAIAGVVNLKLKEKQDGLDLNLRWGNTDQGGGGNIRAQAVGGITLGKLDLVAGSEISSRDPIFWGQRDISNSYSRYSTEDVPQIPPPIFSIRNPQNQSYYDPAAGTCAALSGLQGGTVQQVASSSGGSYCGSDAYYNYRTIQTKKDSQSFYGHATYHLSEHIDLFGSALYTHSGIANVVRSITWSSTFYNLASDRLERWSHTLTPEETGGAMGVASRYREAAWNAVGGLRGTISDTWHWELSYNRSEYRSDQSRLRLLSTIDNFYLGQAQGQVSGYNAYDVADSRLYTPLTVSDFHSLSKTSTSHNSTELQDGLFSLNGTLLQLPAGPLDVAGTVEIGENSFNNTPDPASNQGVYWNVSKELGSSGSRQRQAIAGEARVPLFTWLTVSGAGRYDWYEYGGNHIGAATYSSGVEIRPLASLLIRGSLSSSFRAPDMNYVFQQETRGYYPNPTDYYQCRLDKQPYSSCTDFYNMNYVESGNKQLKPERGQSLAAGFTWSPDRHFDLSFDYYRIGISDEVTSLDVDQLLRQEADCQLGASVSGSPVDPNSSLCRDYLSRVTRNPATAVVNANQVTEIRNNPINAANEHTQGLDVTGTARWEIADIGQFSLEANYTRVLSHGYTQFAGDPPFDYLNDLAYQTDWKDRANASLTYHLDPISLTAYVVRFGGVPKNDYSAERSPYTLVNLSGTWDVTPKASLSVIVNNVADSYPVDKSGGWPYYSIGYYDIYGRQIWLQGKIHLW